MVAEPHHLIEFMKKTDRIIKDPVFLENLKLTEELEQDRVFCRHGLQHLLDTARIAWIKALEDHLDLDREVVYGAALVHDIGRGEEYRDGTPHDEASSRLAEGILLRSGFSAEETELICRAVGGHRKKDMGNSEKKGGFTLEELLKFADNRSRNCLFCSAYEECKWSEERKNSTVTY